MFAHRSFLIFGGGTADILSLIKGGYEILNFRFRFKQGVGTNGKATTKVHGGTIDILLSQLPDKEHIDWALNSRKYLDGMIVSLDADNMPIEKVFFQNATCTYFKIDFLQSGSSYLSTKLEITAEKLKVGSLGDITFDNKWIND
ncbi:MAG: type VI secretion system needle protein Hcp [Tannerella sp.]|jgi:hypothetical protein|nr:type VI secretion system needle protein Hcp [Tannerella sp.]